MNTQPILPPPSPRRAGAGFFLFAAPLCALVASLFAAVPAARAGIAYGSINNFDTVNDTGVPCHGFEIELDDIHSSDISYTYDWNHYGTPRITEDNSNPLHPRVIVRYAATWNNGAWSAYTAVPTTTILPTDGHQFTDPTVNFGGEHFGVGYLANPSGIRYHWLVDDGTASGNLVAGPPVNIGTPVFVYVPPAPAAPAVVQAVIAPPPPPELPVLEFGPATWVKEIRTTSHNKNEVKLRDLVSRDPDDPEREDWRNGEPDEVEVEWQLFQTDYNKNDGGANGVLEAEPQELPDGDETVTRRYEFFEYLGPIDPESGEGLADRVAPDGIHGTDDYADIIIVGKYLGAQMSAFDADSPVGMIDHLQDGDVGIDYPTRSVVIAGDTLFVATTSGPLPDGLSFDPISGQISGTPLAAGTFTFTVDVLTGTNTLSKTYTVNIADIGEIPPPRNVVDTSVSPPDSGLAGGSGAYDDGALVTVTAAPADGFAFVNWTDNGRIVSSSPVYQFNLIVNRSLVANFVPDSNAPPRLAFAWPQVDTLVLSWPTNKAGFVLQHNMRPDSANWQNVTNPVGIAGTRYSVTVSPLPGNVFFRLKQ